MIWRRPARVAALGARGREACHPVEPTGWCDTIAPGRSGLALLHLDHSSRPRRPGNVPHVSQRAPRSVPRRPGDPHGRLLRPRDRRGPVRLPRRRALLLPALSAGRGRVGRRPVAALGARGERRDAPGRQPHGRRALPGQGPLPDHALPARGPVVRDRPHPARLRRGRRPGPVAGDRRRRGRDRRRGLCVRGAGPLPVLQHHLSRRRGVAAVGPGRGRRLAPSREAVGDRGAGRRAGDAGPRRRPPIGLPHRPLLGGLRPRARARRAEEAARFALARGRSDPGRRRRADRLGRRDPGPGLGPAARPAEGADAADADVLVESLHFDGGRGVLGAGGPPAGRAVAGRPERRGGARAPARRPGGGGRAGGPARRGPVAPRRRVRRPDRPRGRRGQPRHLPVQPRAVSSRRDAPAQRLRHDEGAQHLLAQPRPTHGEPQDLGRLALPRCGDAGAGPGRDGRPVRAALEAVDGRRRGRLAHRRLRRVPRPDPGGAGVPRDGPTDRPPGPLILQRDPPGRLPPRRRRQPVSPALGGPAGVPAVPLPEQAAHADGARPGHARRPRLGPRRGRRPPRGPPMGRGAAGRSRDGRRRPGAHARPDRRRVLRGRPLDDLRPPRRPGRLRRHPPRDPARLGRPGRLARRALGVGAPAPRRGRGGPADRRARPLDRQPPPDLRHRPGRVRPRPQGAQDHRRGREGVALRRPVPGPPDAALAP